MLTERAMSPPEQDRFETRIEFACAVCGYDGLSVRGEGQTTCPRCRESFSTTVSETFALVEHDGWAVTVALDGSEGETVNGESPSEPVP